MEPRRSISSPARYDCGRVRDPGECTPATGQPCHQWSGVALAAGEGVRAGNARTRSGVSASRRMRGSGRRTGTKPPIIRPHAVSPLQNPDRVSGIRGRQVAGGKHSDAAYSRWDALVGVPAGDVSGVQGGPLPLAQLPNPGTRRTDRAGSSAAGCGCI